MKLQKYFCITSLNLLCLVVMSLQAAPAQDSQAGKQSGATQDGWIWRRGETYDVPPLRIRLLNGSTREPRSRTPVRVSFESEWVQTLDPEGYHWNDGKAAIEAEAVTDADGFFITNATTIVPVGLAPPGDNPLFVPRFVHISVGYEIPGGHGGSYIEPETIEAVRSGQLAYIEILSLEKDPRPDESRTEADVIVHPNAYWTNSTVRVKRGDIIHVRATGTIFLGRQGSCGPDGIGAADPDASLPDKQFGALIAVIGDGNDDFIFIGAEAEFVSRHDGLLFFGVNEGDLSDNSGTFSARVRVHRQVPTEPSEKRVE